MPETLLQGFREFCEKAYGGPEADMPALVSEGQKPKYFMISCIDSRSNPGTIFKASPGTFFAHKAMGAIVRPFKKGTALAAALQFALRYNRVETIIVLGHTKCGAINALIEGIDDPEISSFLSVAQVGLEKARKKHQMCCEHEGTADLHRMTEEQIVIESLSNLKTYPSVREALEDGRLTLRGWLFDMERGMLLEHDESATLFREITQSKSMERAHA